MAQFKIGDPVVKIDSDAHGTVIAVRSGRGRVIYTVVFDDGTQSTVLEPDLLLDSHPCDDKPGESLQPFALASIKTQTTFDQVLLVLLPLFPLERWWK